MSDLYDQGVPSPAGHRDVRPERVAETRGRVRIVDVREPHELSGELGHIPGVEPAPLGTLDAAAKDWDKEQEIVLVCRSGARSGRAAAALSAAGFTRVMNMIGGMLAWNEAKLPVVR